MHTLQGTLRGHSQAITALEVLYIPTTFSYNDGSDHVQFLKPTLLAGDGSGTVIWWDLHNRRPILSWQAHEGPEICSVVTLSQLGLQWTQRGDENERYEVPVIDPVWFGCFLSHAKDGQIKIWRLFTPTKCGENGLGFQPAGEMSQPPELVVEMPVNTLNFCNVAARKDVLVTAATSNSDCLDVYRIAAKEDKIKRLFKAVDAAKLVQEKDLPETDESTEVATQKGFGIVMKIVWIDDTHFSVGYESGHIITFSLDTEVKVTSVNSCHSPQSVTALYYDQPRDAILSGSPSDRVFVNNRTQKRLRVHRIKHKGVGDISVSTNGTVGVVTWDGYTRFYALRDEKDPLETLFKVRRQIPSIADNKPTEIKEDDSRHPQRAGVVAFSKTQTNYHLVKSEGRLEYNNGMSKNLVRRRIERNFDNQWLLIGYKDGRIAVYAME